MTRDFSSNEQDFTLKSLKEGLRLDFRDESTYRKISISVGPRHGHSEVRLGKTKVITTVTEEIASPLSKRPQEGIIRFRVDLPALPSPGLDDSRTSETSIILSRLLNKTIMQSHCLDLESLCIIPGEKVLALNVTVNAIDQDGNIADCACLSAMASLLSFRYPQMSVEGSKIKLHEEEDATLIPLTVYSVPLLISFAIVDDNTCIVDPTNIEEIATDNSMTFAVTQDKKVSQILKAGKAPIDPETLYRCSQIAILRYTEIYSILEKSLGKVSDLNLLKTDIPI